MVKLCKATLGFITLEFNRAETLNEQLKEFMHRIIPQEEQENFMGLVSGLLLQNSIQHIGNATSPPFSTIDNNQIDENTERDTPQFLPDLLNNETSNAAAISTPQNKKRRGINDFEGRHGIKKCKTTKEKIELCVELSKHDKADLTESARVWIISTLDPMIGCLKNHCNNNVDQFTQKWDRMSHSTFKKKCCRGIGAECGLSE